MPALCSAWGNLKRKGEMKKYYSNQQNMVDGWKTDEKFLREDDAEARRVEEEQSNRDKIWDTRLATFTILLNICLIGAKVLAAILSHSLAVVASVVDSAMDIISGLVIWYTCRAIEKSNKQHYPVGLNRLEPLTVLIVGLCMIFANLIVVEEAVTATATNNLHPKVDIITLVILCTGTGIKLVLFLICRVRSSSSSQVLAIDQRNDCITNMVALGGAYIGHRWWKYADPIGALFVSGLIIITWLGTVREQVPLLIGKAASPEFLHRIVSVSINHDPRIKCIDTVFIYHFGANFLVELHVVMDGDLSLQEAHDIAEGLQTKLERLPFVERAFVHADHTLDGDEHV